MVNLCLFLFAALLAYFRFHMSSHPVSIDGSYEAIAHLFVGGLLGAWLVSRKYFYLVLVVALSGFELFSFLSR